MSKLDDLKKTRLALVEELARVEAEVEKIEEERSQVLRVTTARSLLKEFGDPNAYGRPEMLYPALKTIDWLHAHNTKETGLGNAFLTWTDPNDPNGLEVDLRKLTGEIELVDGGEGQAFPLTLEEAEELARWLLGAVAKAYELKDQK